MFLVRQRHSGDERRAFRLARLYFTTAVPQPQPLSDTDGSESAAPPETVDVEAHARIRHAKRQSTVVARQGDRGGGGAGMSRHIAQGFHSHTINAHRGLE